MPAPIVYRSRDPEVLAAADAWSTRLAEFDDAVREFVRSVDATEWVERSGGGLRGVIDPAGPGWRAGTPSPDGLHVPDRRTRAGKSLDERIERVNRLHPGRRPALPGMPGSSTGLPSNGGISTPGLDFTETGVLYITWGGGTAPALDGRVDDRWEPVPLSEWYARLEAREQAGRSDA